MKGYRNSKRKRERASKNMENWGVICGRRFIECFSCTSPVEMTQVKTTVGFYRASIIEIDIYMPLWTLLVPRTALLLLLCHNIKCIKYTYELKTADFSQGICGALQIKRIVVEVKENNH